MTGSGFTLRDGMELAGLSSKQLWLRYLAIGGDLAQTDMDDHVNSDACRDDHEHNIIAQAINEAFLERGEDHPVHYRHLYQGDPGPR